MDALTSLFDLHAQIEEGLNARLAEIVAQEAEAQGIISRCFEQRQQLDRERAALKDAERIYRDAFGAGDNAFSLSGRVSVPLYGATSHTAGSGIAPANPNGGTDQIGALSKQVRARIGPQRFLMLDAISTMTALNLSEIATLTKLNLRRVKDQMTSDQKLGVVAQSGEDYSLTIAGMELLERYKAYKRSHGQPLPTADDLPQEDDRDELGTDDQMEGESDMTNARASPPL